MSKTIRVKLSEPIFSHGEPVRELVFREPTYDEYVSCGGEPYSVGQSADGVVFPIEKAEVIWAYAQACLVSPKDPLLLETQGPGSWRVAREVRQAVLGFFQEVVAASEPSPTSPTTSSSNSNSPSTPSAA